MTRPGSDAVAGSPSEDAPRPQDGSARAAERGDAAPRTRLLVVAGHDSSGAAGLDADLSAGEELGAELDLVATARTRQDAGGLVELGALAPQAWLAEALAALDSDPLGLKLGLCPEGHAAAAAELVLALRARRPAAPVVLDPVLGPTRGGRFLSRTGVAALVDVLGPLGLCWTPNLPEAAELTGLPLAALEAAREPRVEAARGLLARGAAAVCLKGGHGPGELVVDLALAAGGEPIWLERRRVAGAGSAGGARLSGSGLRGSGCRYATALAIELARGAPLPAAAARAGELVARAIARAGEP